MKTAILTIAALIIGGLVFFRLISAPASLETPPSVSGIVRYVVDGDSLYIRSHKPQIRLWGVDAPERGQGGYSAATDALSRYAKGRHVDCRQIDIDRYGRTVARCFLDDGREINRLMIESGAAREFFRYSKGFYSR